MATDFTFPLSCWMGLQAGTEVFGRGYARQPVTFEEFEPGYAASSTTVQWGVCGNAWGNIDAVNLYDAATGGNLIGTGEVAAGSVQANMYDILRVPAGGYQVALVSRPDGDLLMPPGSGIGSPYGMFGYGIGPYEALEVGVLLLLTFGTVQLCGGEPGDWTPAGPFDATVVV